ncbi:MAG: hypothetical protein IAI50_05680 [Candidatus Eremiobacteraeota bacterium]|nr:hypothetical protein [Candidatus Eremiobacteraeota bacterium]
MLDSPAELLALYQNGWATKGETQIVGGTLYLANLMFVIVDHVVFDGKVLVQVVKTELEPIAKARGTSVRVVERDYPREEPRRTYERLVNWAADVFLNKGDTATFTGDLRDWYEKVNVPGKSANLKRFANYLTHGTLSALVEAPGHLSPGVRVDGSESHSGDLEEDWRPDLWTVDDFRLSADRLHERDKRLGSAESSELRLTEALALPDGTADYETRVAAAWDEYSRALEKLNDWITSTRVFIRERLDDYCSSAPGAHDSTIAAALAAWADGYEEIVLPREMPYDFAKDPIRWQLVREFADAADL